MTLVKIVYLSTTPKSFKDFLTLIIKKETVKSLFFSLMFQDLDNYLVVSIETKTDKPGRNNLTSF